jgi:hypothetical protein
MASVPAGTNNAAPMAQNQTTEVMTLLVMRIAPAEDPYQSGHSPPVRVRGSDMLRPKTQPDHPRRYAA